uniref:TspO/MBR-related protein n=1 Tax=Leucosporidium scottii TaxID=5278 RepID=A0A0H5G9V3_9BASI|nr:hypothetical protein ls5930a1_00143 [Leucosporidium scottii]
MASGQLTKSSIKAWYEPRAKPPGTPPGIAFPIAWTILYASMGLASHLLVNAYDSAIPGSALKATADLALKMYWGQYALNLLWTPLFFGLRKPVPAFVDISILTPLTCALTYQAAKFDSRTTYLLAPYCAWLTFATYLNGGFWWLNFGPASKKGKDL